MILLDGLDEIGDIRRREEIVNLVKKCLDQYSRTHNFLSVFDDEIVHTQNAFNLASTVFDIPLPVRYPGNQVIVTSRIVGYQLNPIYQPSVVHYSIMIMSRNYLFGQKMRTGKGIPKTATRYINDVYICEIFICLVSKFVGSL